MGDFVNLKEGENFMNVLDNYKSNIDKLIAERKVFDELKEAEEKKAKAEKAKK